MMHIVGMEKSAVGWRGRIPPVCTVDMHALSSRR